MNFLSQYKGLPRQVYILSISRSAVYMGVMFVFPFMSLLLTSRLGYTEAQSGYIIFFASISGIVGNLLGGKLSDQIGRKKVYIAAVVIIIFTMIFAGFICTTRKVVPLIMVMYLFVNMILPTIPAMILDWADDSNRTECYSLLYLASNVGGAIGPIIAGYLFYSHISWIFFSMAIIFTLTALLLYFGVKDIYVPQAAKEKQRDRRDRSSSGENLILIVLKKPILLTFLFCLGLLTLCYINLDFTLPLQLRDLFGLNAGSKYSSLVWTVNGAVVVLLTPFIVAVTKKNHPLLNIGMSCLLYCAGFLVYAFSENVLFFQLAVVVWTCGEILISTCGGIYIAGECPETHKGRSMALYEFARSIGKLSGPVFSGFLLSAFSYRQTWLIVAALCLTADFIIWYLYRISKKNTK